MQSKDIPRASTLHDKNVADRNEYNFDLEIKIGCAQSKENQCH